MRFCCPLFVLASTFVICDAAVAQRKQAEPIFSSELITTATKGHAIDVDVDISGARELYLVVTDGGNSFSCDWADWAEPRLVGPGGEKKLTELKWKEAQSGWGDVRLNQNCNGGPLKIADKPVSYGIGTHANSVIAFDLPEGYTRFKARAGLDNGGTDQTGGSSVRFMVYNKKPPKALLNSTTDGGGEGREPDDAVAGLDVAEGLEATLFAAEPMVVSLTNLDVDHRGRVWVCEVVNYRGNNGRRPEGDRILILEDTDGDGRADESKVFYQGRDVDSAMGICVLGNRVIVSASPNIFVFTDEDGDDKPDRKEVLFTKTGQPQHDHSAHSFLFGPDGKLYWNFGNTGQAVHDKDGNVVVDLAGNKIIDNGQPYFGGMPFRCNLDGSEMETLAHNFRNNYEVTVDSFGTLWQSDNDDDGNQGVRINYVMEFGNFGYREEFTGAGWREPRTNMETEVPLQHWHLNDPGVVPNLLQTGAGSPTGITVYEGDLLPEVFRNQVIHCDAGPNIVRAYPVENDGAGYKAEIVDVLDGTRDKWFRPADVCVAPDGSLFVTDWYDPGVGGHGQRDLARGRIFRVAPKDHKYEVPKFNFDTAAGAIAALRSPNYAARYMAWTALHKMGEKAEPALLNVFAEDKNSRMRARALWLLAKIDGRGKQHVESAIQDQDANIRITALRAARQLKLDVIDIVSRLVDDPSPQVRRECAIALRHSKNPQAAELWAKLASHHDGKDRWYLEALGIGADLQWDTFFAAWLNKVGDQSTSGPARDIVWRSRADAAMPLLAKLILDPQSSSQVRLRYFRAFDFHRPQGDRGKALKNEVLTSLLFGNHPDQAAIRLLALERLGQVDISQSPELAMAAEQSLKTVRDPAEFVELVARFGIRDRYEDVLKIAQRHADDEVGVRAIGLLLSADQVALIRAAVAQKDVQKAQSIVRVLGKSTEGRTPELLMPLVKDESQPAEIRREATRALAQRRGSAMQLIKMAKAGQLDESIKTAAALPLSTAAWDDVRQAAAELFPLPAGKDNSTLPALTELLKMRGDAERGRVVFTSTGTCNKCHQVGGEGKEVGPKLTDIGAKLSRSALFESILYPNAAISHSYETHSVLLENGTAVSGIVISDTPEEIVIRPEDAIDRKIKKSEIDQMKKQNISIMPADLQKTMTAQELVDVVEYLTTLKQAETDRQAVN